MSLFPAAFRSPELPGMDTSIVIPAPAKPSLKPPKLPPKSNPPAPPCPYLAGGRIRQAPPNRSKSNLYPARCKLPHSEIKSSGTAEPPARNEDTLDYGRKFWNRRGTRVEIRDFWTEERPVCEATTPVLNRRILFIRLGTGYQ